MKDKLRYKLIVLKGKNCPEYLRRQSDLIQKRSNGKYDFLFYAKRGSL